MKVFGQLEKAQLENVTADPASGTPGQAVLNTTQNRIKVDDGLAIVEVTTNAHAQVLTNKDIDGGVATNTRRLTLPKETAANLTALTRKEGTLAFATDTDTPLLDDGANLRPLLTDNNTVAVTNKDIDGGTASNTRRITLPKNTKTNLDGLTRKEATIVYGTDTGVAYLDNGSTLVGIPLSASSVLPYRSVTSTDTATTSDYLLELSGASFTQTLPAPPVGTVFEIVHAGAAHFTNAYTLATTSGGFKATNGVVASGSYVLRTIGERVKLFWNGTDYLVLSHQTHTGSVLFTPTIGATTTPPTVATTNIFKVTWSRLGDRMIYQFNYSHAASAGAANGSGTYLFPLPSGATIDTAKVDFDTAIASSAKGNVGNGNFNSTTGGTGSSIGVIVYDSSNFKLVLTNSTNNLTILNNATGLAVATFQLGFTASVPITGWQP